MNNADMLWENDPFLVEFSPAMQARQELDFFEAVKRLTTDPAEAFKNEPKRLTAYIKWLENK